MQPHQRLSAFIRGLSDSLDSPDSLLCVSQVQRCGHDWGLPRNDLIVAAHHALPGSVREAERKLQMMLDGRRLVLYAPTFRSDGSGGYDFTPGEAAALDSLLERYGAVLGVRAHMNTPSGTSIGMRRMVPLPPSAYPDTAALLRITDVLVTDYSSIWLDFALLKRPVILFAHDLEKYAAERGLLYDLAGLLPDGVVRAFDDFCRLLESALAGRAPADLEGVLCMFHRYRDGQATERVIQRALACGAR